jgi:hypothetical protein
MRTNSLRLCGQGYVLTEQIRKGVGHYAPGARSISVRKSEFTLRIKSRRVIPEENAFVLPAKLLGVRPPAVFRAVPSFPAISPAPARSSVQHDQQIVSKGV